MIFFRSMLLTSLLMLSLSSLSAQLEWVKFKGELPGNTIIGGVESYLKELPEKIGEVESHRELPVCRCEYNGAKHSGKVVANKCNIGWGGQEKSVSNFEVLVNNESFHTDWLKSNGTLPDHAVQAGTENGIPIYVARAFHKNGTHPGKVFKTGDGYVCHFGYGGKELLANSFDVLVIDPESHEESTPENEDICAEAANYPSMIVANRVNSIGKERQIDEGYSLISSNFKYQTRVTDDGRLVVEEVLAFGVCDNGRIVVAEYNEVWANTQDKRDPGKDYFLKFQNDGNLCIYSKQDGFVWCSMSNGRNGHHFEITNKGHIEVVNNLGFEVWPD